MRLFFRAEMRLDFFVSQLNDRKKIRTHYFELDRSLTGIIEYANDRNQCELTLIEKSHTQQFFWHLQTFQYLSLYFIIPPEVDKCSAFLIRMNKRKIYVKLIDFFSISTISWPVPLSAKWFNVIISHLDSILNGAQRNLYVF